MRLKKLIVEGVDDELEADGERRMVTPWRSKVGEVGWEALSMLASSLIKLFFEGLYV
jgi:hypothetical protein